MRAALPLVLAGVLLAAVAAAGCADDRTREREYANRVLSARASLDEAYEDVARSGEDSIAGADQLELEALAEQARRAHAKVRALTPPQHLRDEDRRIVRAFAEIERGTAALAAAGGTRRQVERRRAGLRTYIDGTVQLDAEIDRLRDGGG